MSKHLFSLLAVGLIASAAMSHAVTYNISEGSGVFAPAFRSVTDLNFTTYYGWGSGSFDGSTNNELIDSPAPTLGVGGLDGSLNQIGTNDILTGGNDIYTLFNASTTVSLGIKTNGTVGTGFTTIIIQGSAAPGGDYSTAGPVFGNIAGVGPTSYVIGTNTSGLWQFWAQYEIAGNAADYSVNFTMGMHNSINTITVDTQWSSSGYADVSAVPEPSTWALLGLSLGAGVLWMRRRRKAVAA